jgi:acetyl esterase/lipase
MWPENKFPAASEDVAEVYKEILKKYAPEHVGLYGCSAGGMLTGMSIAWFQKHQLPSPAAAGVLCASLGDMFAGDAAHLSGPLNGMTTPPRSVSRPSAPVRGGFGYLSDAEVRAGVDAELHVWDGLPHAFWYNSDLPESREAYDVIARFFERHLAN